MKYRAAILMIALLLLAAPALAVPGEKGAVHEKGWANNADLSEDKVTTPIISLVGNETDEAPEIDGNESDQVPEVRPTRKIPPGLAKRLPSMVNETNGTATFPPGHSVWKNQNQVRTAVHTLLVAGEHDGGIGGNISAIAREFNNSVQTRMMAEQQIQERQGLTRLLFGGDQEAAAVLCRHLNQTSGQIREMQRLVENCTCDKQTRTLLMNQLTVMEEDQARLSALVQNETDNRGLFGWLIP